MGGAVNPAPSPKAVVIFARHSGQQPMQESCSMYKPIVHDQPCVKCGGAGPFYVSQPHSWCIECLQRTSRQRYARDRLTIMAARQRRALAAAYATPPDARTRRQTMRILQAEAPAGTKVCTWCWRAQPRTRRFWGPGTTADGCDYYCRACRAILDKLRKRPPRELATRKALAAARPRPQTQELLVEARKLIERSRKLFEKGQKLVSESQNISTRWTETFGTGSCLAPKTVEK